MKKIIALLLLALSYSTPSSAHGYRYYGNDNWLVPALVGGLIGYAFVRPQYIPPVYTAPVYTPPPVYYNPYPYYRYVTIWDGYCPCYRTVMVSN